MAGGDEPERFQWADANGGVVRLSLVDVRVTQWTFERADTDGD